MEIIVITDDKECEDIIEGAKIIRNSLGDILSVIETEIFLNHHRQLSFYFLNNNFPFKFQLPLKVASLLIQRRQSQIFQLIVNQTIKVALSRDTNLLEIFSKIQIQNIQISSFKKQDKDLQGGDNLKYCFKHWNSSIFLNFMSMESILKISKEYAIQTNESSSVISSEKFQNKQQVIKIILCIDNQNKDEFVQCSELLYQFNHIYDSQAHQLSNQYLSLKQQIQNQKNNFAKKIKVVEAILGQKINIQKIVCDEDGKQQNSEYNRLKEIFQTIRNIDNVLVEQQANFQYQNSQLINLRKQKSILEYRNAKNIVKCTKQIQSLRSQIQNLQYKVQTISKQKQKFNCANRFDISNEMKKVVEKQKRILKENLLKVSNQFKSMPKKHQKNNSMYLPQSNQIRNRRYKENMSMIKKNSKIRCLGKINDNSAKIQKLNKQREDQQIEASRELAQMQKLIVLLHEYYEKINVIQRQILFCDKKNKKQKKTGKKLITRQQFPASIEKIYSNQKQNLSHRLQKSSGSKYHHINSKALINDNLLNRQNFLTIKNNKKKAIAFKL